jgi:hypothetical protein
MLSYLRDHFRGRLPLGRSFWINFVALAAVLHLAGATLHEAVSDGSAFPARLAWFLAVNVVVYTWQVCGVWRALEQALIDYADSLWIRAAQAVVLASLVVVFIQALEVVHLGHVHYLPPPERNRGDDRAYVLELSADGSVVKLSGAIDFGITQDLKTLLEHRTSIRVVHLESGGGLVSEGRGLAQLIARSGLTTYSEIECSSACTLAYASGTERHLGPRARLGFHGYRLDSAYMSLFMNPAEEMRKDLTLFRSRGIAAAFLERVFSTPSSDMWFPSHGDLLEAGVVHAIGRPP